MSNADHAAYADTVDADAFGAILLDALAIDSQPDADPAVPVAAESHALPAEPAELSPVAANAVADTVARAFNTESAAAVAAAANRCVEPKQPVRGPGHERSARPPEPFVRR